VLCFAEEFTARNELFTASVKNHHFVIEEFGYFSFLRLVCGAGGSCTTYKSIGTSSPRAGKNNPNSSIFSNFEIREHRTMVVM
jgi:hypothetical protein